MSPFPARLFLRLAVIGALAATLGLAGCGRKGPLEPPPGASLAGVPQPYMPELIDPSSTGSQAQTGNPGVGANGEVLAPQGPHKRIPLDALLN